MTIMTRKQVGAWCKEMADHIYGDALLLDIFTRAYCAKEEDMDTPVLKIGYQDYHKTLHGINGCNNLHQKSVEIFDREEDEETGLHVVAERDKQLLVDEDMSNNPSSRRQGLKINFSCECCEGKVHTLNIAQHKGTTFVFWSE